MSLESLCVRFTLEFFNMRHGNVLVQVRYRSRGREETTFIKGSLESVLEHCTSFLGRQNIPTAMTEEERRRVLDAASALGSKGRR